MKSAWKAHKNDILHVFFRAKSTHLLLKLGLAWKSLLWFCYCVIAIGHICKYSSQIRQEQCKIFSNTDFDTNNLKGSVFLKKVLNMTFFASLEIAISSYKACCTDVRNFAQLHYVDFWLFWSKNHMGVVKSKKRLILYQNHP